MSRFTSDDEALESLSDDAIERYARQLVLPEVGALGQSTLLGLSVALVGMGGIGCPAAQALVQSGVGELTLIDPDTVDISNLPRQLLFRASDLGRPKALVAAEVLEESSPDLSLRVEMQPLREQNVGSLLAGHDIIIDGTDNFRTRCVVADWVQSNPGARLVSASVTGTDGQLLCLDENTEKYSTLFPEGPPPEQNCADVGVLTTASMMLGLLAAHTALEWTLREQKPHSALVSTWPLRIMRLTV